MPVDEISTLAKLFSLLIYSDGNVHPKEIELGKRMAHFERMDEEAFFLKAEKYHEKDDGEVYLECVEGLKSLPLKGQINYIAWMILIANADGFMDNDEWGLIYKIFHHELGLEHKHIAQRRKDLRLQLGK